MSVTPRCIPPRCSRWCCSLAIAATAAATDWLPALRGRTLDVARAERPPDDDHYLANDIGGQVDHHVLWFGIDEEVTRRLRAAEVLFVGNSRLMFALRPNLLRPFFGARGISYYVMGFGFRESDRLPLALIRKLDLRPRLVVANADGFFGAGAESLGRCGDPRHTVRRPQAAVGGRGRARGETGGAPAGPQLVPALRPAGPGPAPRLHRLPIAQRRHLGHLALAGGHAGLLRAAPRRTAARPPRNRRRPGLQAGARSAGQPARAHARAVARADAGRRTGPLRRAPRRAAGPGRRAGAHHLRSQPSQRRQRSRLDTRPAGGAGAVARRRRPWRRPEARRPGELRLLGVRRPLLGRLPGPAHHRPPQDRAAVRGRPHRCQRRLLRLARAAVSADPGGDGAARLRRRARHRPLPAGRPRAAAPLAAALARRQSRRARVLQVRQLRRPCPRGHGEPAGRLAAPARARPGAADGHQLLHLPDAVLHGGRLSRPAGAGAQLSALPAVRQFLSAAGRRPDRAGERVPAADRSAAAVAAAGVLRRGLAGHLRVLPQDGLRRQPRRLRRRVLVARRPRRHRRDVRAVAGGDVLGADLRRLLRLLDHRPRSRLPARVSLPDQLRRALHRRHVQELLGALAHHAVALAARLSVPAARRQPRIARPHPGQSAGGDAARRPVARRGLHLHRLGSDSRRLPRRRARVRAAPARGPSRHGGRAASPGSASCRRRC